MSARSGLISAISGFSALALLGLAAPACGDLQPQDAAGALGRAPVSRSRVVAKPAAAQELRKRATSTKLGQPLTLRRPPSDQPKDPPPPEDPPAEQEPAPPPPRAEDGALAGMTAEHNKVRAQVGVAPLSWSPALGGVAQQWADYLATENNCQLTHRPAAQQQYGENLYWHSATASAVAAAGSWAAEAASYTYQTGACSGVCGHYTQMVWADTRYVGCGFARCTGDGAPLSGGEIIVCNYDPRGNYVGQKPY